MENQTTKELRGIILKISQNADYCFIKTEDGREAFAHYSNCSNYSRVKGLQVDDEVDILEIRQGSKGLKAFSWAIKYDLRKHENNIRLLENPPPRHQGLSNFGQETGDQAESAHVFRPEAEDEILGYEEPEGGLVDELDPRKVIDVSPWSSATPGFEHLKPPLNHPAGLIRMTLEQDPDYLPDDNFLDFDPEEPEGRLVDELDPRKIVDVSPWLPTPTRKKRWNQYPPFSWFTWLTGG